MQLLYPLAMPIGNMEMKGNDGICSILWELKSPADHHAGLHGKRAVGRYDLG